MKSIPPMYLRAAISLGCPPLRSVFWNLCFRRPCRELAPALLVFILCIGYYVTPALLGGPTSR